MSVDKLRECLLNLNEPIAKRTHAAFFLRTNGSQDAVDAIAAALQQKADCPLMRHELAYILGQMQNKCVCPILEAILDDADDDVLVRHESAEALGALGDDSFLDVLLKHIDNEHQEIAETCQIAVDLIRWKQQNVLKDRGQYLSVDPAPPMSERVAVKELQSQLMDTSRTLFDRYRAMFSLRNLNSDDSALALAEGFNDGSALFRHEVAYVLGQMQRSCVVDALVAVLSNKVEHRMVRHEAAEALGAIGGANVEEVLKRFSNDEERVVEESCVVALDSIDYWTQFSDGR